MDNQKYLHILNDILKNKPKSLLSQQEHSYYPLPMQIYINNKLVNTIIAIESITTNCTSVMSNEVQELNKHLKSSISVNDFRRINSNILKTLNYRIKEMYLKTNCVNLRSFVIDGDEILVPYKYINGNTKYLIEHHINTAVYTGRHKFNRSAILVELFEFLCSMYSINRKDINNIAKIIYGMSFREIDCYIHTNKDKYDIQNNEFRDFIIKLFYELKEKLDTLKTTRQ